MGFSTAAVISRNSGTSELATVSSPHEPSYNTNTSQFDDLTAVPALPEVDPVGTYKGLQWNAFNVLEQTLGKAAAVEPQSGLNVASNGFTDDLDSSPSIQIISSYSTFDLQSLYFGCVIDSLESVAGVAEDCTITLTAYKKSAPTTPFATAALGFTPSNPLLANPMVHYTLPSSWSGLDKVDFAVVASTTPGTLTALLVDSVSYVLHK